MEQYGIDETKDIIKAFVSLANVIDSTTQDGFQLSDIFEYVEPLSKIPAAVSGAEKVPLELYDMSEDEKNQIIQDIEELKFESAYSELIAEQALKSVAEFAVLMVIINMAKDKQPIQEIFKIIKKILK